MITTTYYTAERGTKMGASNIHLVVVGKYEDAIEAYTAACMEAEKEYGKDPFRGISTTAGVKTAPYKPYCLKSFHAYEQELLENSQKWGPVWAMELEGYDLKKVRAERPELKGQRGIKAFVFIGWAAE